MNNVKSKYKNPDSFIKKLKREVKWLRERRNDAIQDAYKNRGKVVVNYVSNNEKTISVTSNDLGTLKPKDKIVIVGRVRKVNKYLSLGNNIHSEAIYELLQVRKMPDRW